MDFCPRCNEIPHIEDYKAMRGRVGSPGLHVRRFLCACGCKAVHFYHVVNVSLVRPGFPKPGHESTIPQSDFPIYQADYNA